MADAYELLINADLPDDLSEAEVNELRWHLGLGPEPPECTIVTEFPGEFVDEDGNPTDYAPGAAGSWVEVKVPALARRGPAWRIGGVLFAALERREYDQPRPGWALTCRQEIHPDDFERTTACVEWLQSRVSEPQFDLDVYWRFHEDPYLEPTFLDEGGLVTRQTVITAPSPEVLRLIADGKSREAVVQARKDTDLSIKQARSYVEALRAGRVVLR
ncbi:hypothetical protein [Actinomadura sp. 6N118]|uniref:hypothetical protein n=1 Tax=Actinomadura sp. 6N118 TaxID=3375151 RepID=UPI0037BA0844